MCYSVYISTDSDDDLSLRNSELLRFERLAVGGGIPYETLLGFANKWYVGSKSHCSCTFRHLHSVDLGFSAPVDWYPEEEPEIAATSLMYAVLAGLLSGGALVDLIDVWEGAQIDHIITLDVSLSAVPAAAFRLFENHKFQLIA